MPNTDEIITIRPSRANHKVTKHRLLPTKLLFGFGPPERGQRDLCKHIADNAVIIKIAASDDRHKIHQTASQNAQCEVQNNSGRLMLFPGPKRLLVAWYVSQCQPT